VKWTIPLSLGDSHRGFRVLGTSQGYFQFYRYADKKSLLLSSGKVFDDLYDAVIGAEVAKRLGYRVGQPIILSHGTISTDFSAHKDKPFRVVGILQATGTPVDRSVHVSLEAIEAIHIDWRSGARSRLKINAEQARDFGLKPNNLTAVMVGLNKRIQTFAVQRDINDDQDEALLAIIPGTTLSELWRTLGHFETILLAVSLLVLVSGLLGMLTMLLSTLNERRREMAVLRAVGAHAYQIIVLFMLEAFLMVFLGCLLSIGLLFILLQMVQPILLDIYGFNLSLNGLDFQQWVLLFSVLIAGSVFSLIPGVIAYRRSLQDGLMVRL
jgi:putative ABC transport system permease protein